MFDKLGFVMIVVSDLRRSRDFYAGTLGLPLMVDRPQWVEFNLNGLLLGLHPENPEKNLTAQFAKRSGITIGFMVPDLDASVAELKKRGATVLQEPTNREFGALALLEDPDGYVIQLAELDHAS